jgi:hypothetical protein
LRTNEAVSKPPAPVKKLRRSSMNALLQFHAHRRAGPIVARKGPHRLHHRCRSRLVGGADRPLWMLLGV